MADSFDTTPSELDENPPSCNSVFSLQDRLHEARMTFETNRQRVLMEYIPNADVIFRIQRIGRLLLYIFLSSVSLMMICHAVPALNALMIGFFRLILSPITPILKSHAAGQIGPLLTILAITSQFLIFILSPVVMFLTISIAMRKSFLYLDGNHLFILKPASTHTSEAAIVVNDVAYLVRAKFTFSADTRIRIERSSGKRSFRDYLLRIDSPLSNGIESRWGDIVKAEDRYELLAELEKRLPRTFDRSVFEPFRPVAAKQSYTEIWLKELSGAPKRDRLTPLAPGSKLDSGNYTVLEKAGVGGQGTVYFADSTKKSVTQTLVVLKEFVLPVYPDLRVRKKAAERFQSEAAMLSRLDHPQIVKFIDLFVEDHRAYVVMELVEGTTLKERVASEGPLSQSEVLSIAMQMAGVMSYLHGQNPAVVHRDVTPDNIIVGAEGVPKLIDFSVAQEISSGVTGSVVGKPNYIAPEQFRGKPTVQSDIYSLGATLYFLLVGQDPPPITILHPHAVKATVDQRFDAVIARCTQLDVSKRYESADQLLAELKTLQLELADVSLLKSPEHAPTKVSTDVTPEASEVVTINADECRAPLPALPLSADAQRQAAIVQSRNLKRLQTAEVLSFFKNAPQPNAVKNLQSEDLDKLKPTDAAP